MKKQSNSDNHKDSRRRFVKLTGTGLGIGLGLVASPTMAMQMGNTTKRVGLS